MVSTNSKGERKVANCNSTENAETSNFELQIIEAVWLELEPFLDICDTISMSLICKTLQSQILDEATGQIKISHFNAPEEHVTNGVKARRPEFISRAFDKIHFPSLSSLKIEFDSISHPPSLVTIFSQLSSKISQASNLTKLSLGVRALLSLEPHYVSPMKELLATFGRNLEECDKLNELTIRSNLWAPFYSENNLDDFFVVMTKVLQRRRQSIENFSMFWQYRFDEGEMILSDFFDSIFSLKNLHSLSLQIQCDFLVKMMILSASRGKESGHTRHEKLRNLVIALPKNIDSIGIRLDTSYSGLLEYFHRCKGLSKVALSLPKRCFEDSATKSALGILLINQQRIKHVTIGFDSYSDEDDGIVRLLLDFVKNSIVEYVNIRQLMGVKGELLYEVAKALEADEDKEVFSKITMAGQNTCLMKLENVSGRVDCHLMVCGRALTKK